MDIEQEKLLKDGLNDSFTDDYIKNSGILIHRLAEEFYEENDLGGKVYFNDEIFQHCLIDILVDIARLKHFHDIKKPNYTKFAAYTASWVLRRKPFQLLEGCEEKYIYVNECFAFTILLEAAECYDKKTGYCIEDEDVLIKGSEQLLYHLKYRNTNPQTLELFLVGMENGKKIRTMG